MFVDVLVIGAGQAGLSAAYNLQKRGFSTSKSPTYLVLDSENGPGGAWRHRWKSLKMGTNGIFDLPGYPATETSPDAATRDAVPAYFKAYEQEFSLNIRRPVKVDRVEKNEAGKFVVHSSSGSFTSTYLINATGTWTRPYWPYYPGQETFAGTQLHVHDYVDAERFKGQRVVVVGAGISAIKLLQELSSTTDTLWVTRQEPQWTGEPTPNQLRKALEKVEERTSQGHKSSSIISVTGMYKPDWIKEAEQQGVFTSHRMFTQIEPHGVRMPDGRFEPADVILWATGFRPEIRHLAPLGLRTKFGGIRVRAGRALDEPLLFLIGYGSTQSTVGANRAGRDAVRDIIKDLKAASS